MKHRELNGRAFVAGLGAVLAASLTAAAQQAKVYRIVDGQNVSIE